jgi:protein SCO1
MKRIFLAAFLLCLCLSCKSRPSAPVLHQGVGVIEEIDRNTAQVQINHEEIKGYMPAMSMPYRVKDKNILALINPGDKVDFTMEDSPAGIFILELKIKEK